MSQKQQRFLSMVMRLGSHISFFSFFLGVFLDFFQHYFKLGPVVGGVASAAAADSKCPQIIAGFEMTLLNASPRHSFAGDIPLCPREQEFP